jgi:hypothetical protein
MKRIPLTQDQYVIVDDDDFAELSKYKWCAMSNGGKRQLYALRNLKRTETGYRPHMLMHRQILKARVGQQVDHLNGNTLDNRRCNLRFSNTSQNAANRQKRGGNSRFKGVMITRRTYGLNKRWRAQIGLSGKSYHLGYFHTEEEAALAYNQAALRQFGQFARLNQLEREG